MFPASTCQGGMAQTPGPTDICKTPAPPSPPVPIPYPNMAQLMMASPATCSLKVKISNFPVLLMGSEIPLSNGDEPGVAGGVISGKNMGACKVMLASMRVMIEGKGVAYLTCLAGMNGMPANFPAGMIATPSQALVTVSP